MIASMRERDVRACSDYPAVISKFYQIRSVSALAWPGGRNEPRPILRSKKMREHAQCFRFFCRERRNRGLADERGGLEPLCQFFKAKRCEHLRLFAGLRANRQAYPSRDQSRFTIVSATKGWRNAKSGDERHLRRVLSSYVDYYQRTRTHLSLDKDCPDPRPITPPRIGKVIAIPQVGGLHHRYQRLAA